MKLLEPKKIELYNNYRRALLKISKENLKSSFREIYDVLHYSHETCHLIDTLTDLEAEFILQLYGICFYKNNSWKDYCYFYGCDEDELGEYVYYLLHKLYPEKLPLSSPPDCLWMFQYSPNEIANYRYKDSSLEEAEKIFG